jgi:hypothetical protein
LEGKIFSWDFLMTTVLFRFFVGIWKCVDLILIRLAKCWNKMSSRNIFFLLPSQIFFFKIQYAISWEAFLEPSDSYFLFADLVGFYPSGGIFRSKIGSKCVDLILIRLAKCWNKFFSSKFCIWLYCENGKYMISWFLSTLNIYAHFSQQLLMAEIWYLVTSFI